MVFIYFWNDGRTAQSNETPSPDDLKDICSGSLRVIAVRDGVAWDVPGIYFHAMSRIRDAGIQDGRHV